MTEEVDNSVQKAEEIAINEEKLEFLSLSCPRASEYVLRTNKINEKEVTCQRGNAEVIDEFFQILESSEIRDLKFHIIDVTAEDVQVFKEKIKKSKSYQVKSIIFNQSADPQLIIDFALKCPDLKSLLVRGYNQKYPCNKTDYLIKVYTTRCTQYDNDYIPCQCSKGVVPPVAENVKSQIPLMCKPIEWSYQEREQLLTEKFPEDMKNAGFIHNFEVFFAESHIALKTYELPTSDVLKENSENLTLMNVRRSKFGVFCNVLRHIDCGIEWACFDSLSPLGENYPIHRDETLRMRSLLFQSDEERDLYPNQKELMDMPLVVIDKIMDNLTFYERLPFRGSCRQLYTFPGSQKHVVKSCNITAYCMRATIDGKLFKCCAGEAKQLMATISRNSYVADLFLDTASLKFFENKDFIKALEDIEPFRVDWLYVHMNRDTYEASMKFIVEKCQGALESISLRCQDFVFDFDKRDSLEKILSARNVHLEGLSYRCATEVLEAFVERAIVSGNDCKFSLNFYYEGPDENISLESFQEKYSERFISTSSSPDSSTLRIRTDDATKHILISSSAYFIAGHVIPADFVEKN